MEQIIWLIVLLLIWIVPVILKDNTKKKKASQMQEAKRQVIHLQTKTEHQLQQNSNQEVEKMLDKLLGVEVTKQEGVDSFEEVPIHDKNEYESIEYDTPEGHHEPQLDTNYDLNRAEKLSFEELIAMGEADVGLVVENIDEFDNVVHPDISEFDLRKAVIYSEIIKPKYF